MTTPLNEISERPNTNSDVVETDRKREHSVRYSIDLFKI